MLTIWDLLASGIIVAHDEQLGMLVQWRKKANMLVLFRVQEGSFSAPSVFQKFAEVQHPAHCFDEVDVKSSDVQYTQSTARKRAEKWLKDIAALEDR